MQWQSGWVLSGCLVLLVCLTFADCAQDAGLTQPMEDGGVQPTRQTRAALSGELNCLSQARLHSRVAQGGLTVHTQLSGKVAVQKLGVGSTVLCAQRPPGWTTDVLQVRR